MPTIREIIQSRGFRDGIKIAAPIVLDKLKMWWTHRRIKKAEKKRRKNARKGR